MKYKYFKNTNACVQHTCSTIIWVWKSLRITVYNFEFAQSYFHPTEIWNWLPSLEFDLSSILLHIYPLYMYIILLA